MDTLVRVSLDEICVRQFDKQDQLDRLAIARRVLFYYGNCREIVVIFMIICGTVLLYKN